MKRFVVATVLLTLALALVALPVLADPGGRGRGRDSAPGQIKKGTPEVTVPQADEDDAPDEGPGRGRATAPGQLKKAVPDVASEESDEGSDGDEDEQEILAGPPGLVRKWLGVDAPVLPPGLARLGALDGEIRWCWPKSFTLDGTMASLEGDVLTVEVRSGNAVVKDHLLAGDTDEVEVMLTESTLFHAYGGGDGWYLADPEDELTEGIWVRVFGVVRCVVEDEDQDDDDGGTLDVPPSPDAEVESTFVAQRILYGAAPEDETSED